MPQSLLRWLFYKDAMVSTDATFKRAFDTTNKEMENKKPAKKQAPLLPIKVIASMEMLVVSEANATFVRFADVSW